MPLNPSANDLFILRNTAAELLAYTMRELFPQILLVGGGATDVGFYYDFISSQPVHEQSLELLEVRMRALAKEEIEIRSHSMMRENAFDFFMHHQQPLLAGWAIEETSNIINLFQMGSFQDLLYGDILPDLGEIKGIKLFDLKKLFRKLPEEGWGEVLRITGTAFSDSYQLKQFLKAYEKLKKYDHRLLGPESQLYDYTEKTGFIDCFWLPKGKMLLDNLTQVWLEIGAKQNVQQVTSPLVIKENFLEKKNTAFPPFVIEEEDYALSQGRMKHHIQLFHLLKNSEELPLRLGEIYTAYEEIEEVHAWGLFRKYSYCSDLVTIFCSEEQLNQELIYSLQFIDQFIRIFSFEAHWYLSSKENMQPQSKTRKQGIEKVEKALQELGMAFSEKPDSLGEPLLEVRFVDALGREWTGPSTGLIMPSRDSEGVVPVVVTRQLFGSVDRFIGLLIEHCKGHLPFWLAPEQIRVLVVGEQNRSFAEQVYNQCKQCGWKVKLDGRDEKLGAKVHTAEKKKIPYLVIVGDKETSKGRITVRSWQEKDRTDLYELDEFLEMVQTANQKIKQ